MQGLEKNAHRILLADDQRDVLEALRLLLKGEGYQTAAVTSPKEVIQTLQKQSFDLLIIDLNYTRDTTSGAEGLDLLGELQKFDANLPVVVMTAWGNIELAVEAMRRGARDFIQKPWDNARLLNIVRTLLELGGALQKGQKLAAENQLLRAIKGEEQPSFIAESAVMQPVLEIISRIGPSDANVLITGEHGAGKDVVAKTLYSVSNRADKPFVKVDVGSLSEGVFESELFGHVKGAFTDAKTERIGRFELASGGTLFLDEIANLPVTKQTKLLRVLETGEFERVGSSATRRVDVRVISATNADLKEEISRGRFRPDLLFRLNTIEIRLPPLRERRGDILLLAEHFLQKYSRRYQKTLSGFNEEAIQALVNYSWMGNVRELSHTIERAVLMSQTDKVRLSDLGILIFSGSSSQNLDEMSLEEVESFLVRKALARFNGNVLQAAQFLGLSRSALYRRMQRYGL